jgi:hypothetical protein
MIAEAISKILEINNPPPPTFIDKAGVERHTKSGDVLRRPKVDHTSGRSLESVVETVSKYGDILEIQCSINQVLVTGIVEDNRCLYTRIVHAATPILPKDFPFGSPMDPEMFIIKASDFFERDDNYKSMISALSCITDVQETVTSDDGVTQTVTYKSGINRKDSGKLEPFVTLRSFRTFREVEQPQDTYLIRLSKGKDGPLVALYEASGYRWKQSCSEAVYKYIKDRVDPKHLVVW